MCMESGICGMSKLLIITIGSLISSAVLLVLFLACRVRERRTMERLREMLEAALEGTFSQKDYDETYLSALETQMVQYLSKTESAVKKMNQHQEKISTLISDISHQTKTPLFNVSLYTELMLEKELPEDAKHCAEQVHAQAEKLQFLIGASANNVTSGKRESLSCYPTEQPVGQMIQNAVAQAEMKTQKKRIAIKESEGYAVFDEHWTQEALYNLLDNAVKYTPEENDIEIQTVSYELFLRIDVTDYGAGIG